MLAISDCYIDLIPKPFRQYANKFDAFFYSNSYINILLNHPGYEHTGSSTGKDEVGSVRGWIEG